MSWAGVVATEREIGGGERREAGGKGERDRDRDRETEIETERD